MCPSFRELFVRRNKARSCVLFLALLIGSFCPAAMADQIITKSGQVYKGRLLKTANKTYYFKTEKDETVEIPAESVYMGDFEPSKDSAFKSYLILHSNSKDEEKTAEASAEAQPDNPPPSAPDARGIVVLKPHDDVLKRAQDTVALSNQRTAQMEQQIKELKTIADNANQ